MRLYKQLLQIKKLVRKLKHLSQNINIYYYMFIFTFVSRKREINIAGQIKQELILKIYNKKKKDDDKTEIKKCKINRW